MKIRNDFVSNSSSCSFVISTAKNLKKTIDVVKETFDRNDEVPYDLELDVMISAKNKNFKEIEMFLTGSSSYKDTYEDYRTGKLEKKDPEEMAWDSVRLELGSFIGKAVDSKFDSIIDKIEEIRFECDDYDRGKCNILSLLYSFFAKRGCRPNSDDSERGFMDNGNPPFLQKLMK